MQLKAEGNAVCYSCHAPEKFDTPDHTHHMATGTGAKCVNCHMPVTTYMVVDDRYDHSIRIPRPDLSETMNTPNACNKCHKDKTVNWAATNFKQWYGDKIPKDKTYGELLYAASKMMPEASRLCLCYCPPLLTLPSQRQRQWSNTTSLPPRR